MVNPAENGAPALDDLPPLQRLLLAYAPDRRRPWHALCWLLDQRLAAIVRRGAEPTIAAIRLAWWDAVLVERDVQKGGGEPLVERWREIAPEGVETVAERLIDGWRLLAAPEPLGEGDLLSYAELRGGGLFALLAAPEAADGEAVGQAGMLWALWDLAAHVRDTGLSARAMALAQSLPAAGKGGLPGASLKPLRLAQAVALPDIAAGAIPSGRFSFRHYRRLLLASLRG